MTKQKVASPLIGAMSRTLYSRTSDQRSDRTQQFLFLWPATSRNKKGSDLNISDLPT
jgi:hypothetical protein